MKKIKAPLKTFGVRVDRSKMKRAKEMGINVGMTMRLSLDKAIWNFDTSSCPTCGRKNNGK